MTVRLQDFQNAGDLAELVGWLEHGAQVGLGRRELMLERMLGGQRPLMLWAQLHQKRSLQLSGQRKHQGHCQILQLLAQQAAASCANQHQTGFASPVEAGCWNFQTSVQNRKKMAIWQCAVHQK